MPFKQRNHHLQPISFLFIRQIPVDNILFPKCKLFLFLTFIQAQLPLHHINFILVKLYLMQLINFNEVAMEQLDVSNFVYLWGKLYVLLDVVDWTCFDSSVLSEMQDCLPRLSIYCFLVFILFWGSFRQWVFYRGLSFSYNCTLSIEMFDVDDAFEILYDQFLWFHAVHSSYWRLLIWSESWFAIDVSQRNTIFMHIIRNIVHPALSVAHEFLLLKWHLFF